MAAALDPPLALEHTAESILAHYRGTYGLRSSMLQDITRGRPTEKNEIVRSLVELGSCTVCRLHGSRWLYLLDTGNASTRE